ncbi:MAG: cation/multidrug efflux pump [Moraxellaceae bacterium]|nr:MAG: cation/multidrug efflux pump [Moraxellaceae bacterium]
MQFSGLAFFIILIAIASLLFAVFILWRPHWILAWLKGSAGLGLIALAVFLVFLAANFNGYKGLSEEEPVATLSFSQESSQRYLATLVDASGVESEFSLDGDLWQIDAKIIKWKGYLLAMGLAPGYKLDRIQGRYLSIEQERRKSRTVYGLSSPGIGFDLWDAARKNAFWLPGVDASYGSATFVPMADGAIYAVNLSSTGFIARPLNPTAEKAIATWK